MSASTDITYTPRRDSTAEAELSVLGAVYKYVLFDSQARKGDPHDLTSESIKNRTTRTDMKGTDNADIHGN
jgi:hypothetical protein